MTLKITQLFLFSLLVFLLIGCGTATTPTPLPTQPPQVITVIITATPPPPTATSPAPTVTPMSTLPLTATVAVATPTQAAVKPTVARPAATRTPTRPAIPPTMTALPMKFGAPSLNRPVWTENQKDEAKFPSGAIILDWKSVGGLGGDECYLIRISTEPVNPGPGIGVASDYWLTLCGDQTAAGASVKFILESPNRPGNAPNYGSILLNTNEMWANWSVTVVKNLGDCDPSYRYHCKTAPISPPGQGRFLFKGG